MSRPSRIARLRAAIRRGARRLAEVRRNQRRRRAALRRLLAEEEGRPARMFDSVDVSQIPADAEAVLGYVDGAYRTWPQLLARFPHAYKMPLAVFADDDATGADVENGDMTIVEAVDWTLRQLARGVKRPLLYHSVSGMDELLAVLAAAGVERSQVRVGTAHYTYHPHLCGPDTCGELRSTTADGTQYSDRALGRDLDVWKLGPHFFSHP